MTAPTASSLSYFLDPALLTPQALAGKASLIPDPSGGPSNFWNGLFTGLNYALGSETIGTSASAPSLSVAVYRSRLCVSGSMTCTLPNGVVEGQRKLVICESAASTPAMVMTVTTPDATTGYVTAAGVQFDTAGQAIEYIWTTGSSSGTAAWRAVRVWRAGVCSVTVGTTVLTNNVLSQVYALSVTGTVSSTGTKAIPAGQVPGEVIHVNTPTAASIPSGTINITGTTIATGAAATALSSISATSAQASFVWDPTNSWQNISVTTATYS